MIPSLLRSIGRHAARTSAGINNLPSYCFGAFVVLNAIKIAIFNQLLVEAGSISFFPYCLNGFSNKLLLILICSIILLKTKNIVLFLLFYCGQTVFILINITYYFSFQGYLHISQYSGLLLEAFDLLTHAALPLDVRLLFVFIDLPFLAVILFFYRRLSGIVKQFLFKPVLYGASVLFLVAFYRWEVPVETPLRLMNNAYESDAAVVKKYGLLTFTLIDLLNYQDAHSHIKKLSYGPPVPVVDTADAHPNILIVQVESLDSYIIDLMYNNRFVMPYLHDLSKKCIFFPYMLSYHLAGSTSDCEFSVINSVEPLDDFPSVKIREYNFPNSVLKRCAAEGYSVAAFHGNRGTYFNRQAAFPRMGFQKFYDMTSMGLPEIGWGASDESVFDFIKSQILHQKPPFLYYCITMSSHEIGRSHV
jgi:lipoteichoic acid synthase